MEKLLEKELLAAASDRDVDAIPFVWFWPNRKAACVVLTHDIETKQGRDYTETIMELESRRGFVASYEVVPESRYAVSDDFLASIRAGGCEVCVHDLNHDGRLFSSLTTFKERVKRINEYGQQYGARGFRSAVMYRHADWMPCLAYSYDMSFPNVAHLDPQRGGCCTVFPYFIGGVLELPLTATQDYTLLHVLRADSDVIWRRQTEGVLNEHGLLTFIVHPDYVIDRRGAHLHDRLLEMLNVLVEERSVWSALPGDVDSWWRQRAQMRVTRVSGAWAVVGPGSDRASVAWAHCQDGRIEVEV